MDAKRGCDQNQIEFDNKNMSSSNSPCGACKVRRQKCTQDCIFAPYFPADQPQKFVTVHQIFGASNVAKLLNELSPSLREDAVKSLSYEAEARLHDQVYGCVRHISLLQQRLKQVQSNLLNAKKELATYIGPRAMLPMLHAQQQLSSPLSSTETIQHDLLSMMGNQTGPSHSGRLMIRDPQQQQIFEAQQLAAAVAATEQQEMLRMYEQQQQQQQLVRFNSGFNASAGTVTPTGFNQMSVAAMSPSLAPVSLDNPYQIQARKQPEQHAAQSLQAQLLLQSQRGQTPPQQQQQKSAGDQEGRSC